MIITTVVTKSQIKDFLLMKGSCEIYNSNIIFDIVCDEYCFDYLSNSQNEYFRCTEDKSLKDGDHVSGNSIKNFENLIEIKFNHALSLFDKYSDTVLWCDCDHIFLSRIEEYQFNDACLTPHYSNNFADERTVGFYNCGFVMIKNKEFIVEWKRLYDKRNELNLYFEQKALELAAKKFTCLILPINYNVGWWKFMNSNFEGNGSFLNINDGLLYEKPIINFHFHFFHKSNHNFSVDELKSLINSILINRNTNNDNRLLKLINNLTNEDI